MCNDDDDDFCWNALELCASHYYEILRKHPMTNNVYTVQFVIYVFGRVFTKSDLDVSSPSLNLLVALENWMHSSIYVCDSLSDLMIPPKHCANILWPLISTVLGFFSTTQMPMLRIKFKFFCISSQTAILPISPHWYDCLSSKSAVNFEQYRRYVV